MQGEIITVGNELTAGRTLDLNAWYAAGRLSASGLKVTRITSVADDYKMLSDALTRAVETARFVIITGGLGSTEDDMTNEIAACALGRRLCLDQEMFAKIKRHTEKRGSAMTPSLEKMAWMPEGSKMLNPQGASCGFSLEENSIPLFFLPGVPDQMRYLMDKSVLPAILALYKTLPVMRQRILKLFGLSEPSIAEIHKKLQEKAGEVDFGFYPRFPENHITISMRGESETAVIEELDRVEAAIRQELGPYIFTAGDELMEEVVARLLKDAKKTVSVAESCTGGLLGHRLTSVAGSSVYFAGGLVAYSNAVKTKLLGVTSETLRTRGAVNEAVVRQMATGVRERIGTDLALATTGIAGPAGGSQEKPVGTVHLALAAANQVFSGRYHFWGNRRQIQMYTSSMALDWLRRYLNGYAFIPGI